MHPQTWQWAAANWEACATLATVALLGLALIKNWAGPDTALLGGLALFMALGIASDAFPTPAQAVAGFGNEGLITVGVLYVVAEGLTRTGAMSILLTPLLGRPRSATEAQARLMLPVAGLSAFLNNTPVVAMFMPLVSDWAKKTGVSPSKLFIPLSYAAIMGGSCTLIGTATNLVVQGMVFDAQAAGRMPNLHIGMFTLSAVGVPAALLGTAYILIASGKLLPDRQTRRENLKDARRYTVEMLVEPASPLAGRTIEQAGLRQLPGAYLVEIQRGDQQLIAVGPEQTLAAGDRLIFVGVVDSVRDLQKIRGLAPATDQVFKLSSPRPERLLVEAVVSDTCPLVGRTIREGRFRSIYHAAIIAVHRNGEHLLQKIGDITLRPGDTLLIETHRQFLDTQRDRRDFFLVSEVAGSEPMRHERAPIALLILVAMVALAATDTLPILVAAMLAAGLMVATNCCSAPQARSAISWRVLLAIGAALGIGKALETTGAAASSADALIASFGRLGPMGALAGVYLVAMIFSSAIGPIAAAVLVFPVAAQAAAGLDADFMPFAITLMMASAASFATPISYQTNLMVYGAGGYRFSDYLRIGLPLNFLVMTVVLTLTPHVWPF